MIEILNFSFIDVSIDSASIDSSIYHSNYSNLVKDGEKYMISLSSSFSSSEIFIIALTTWNVRGWSFFYLKIFPRVSLFSKSNQFWKWASYVWSVMVLLQVDLGQRLGGVPTISTGHSGGLVNCWLCCTTSLRYYFMGENDKLYLMKFSFKDHGKF